MAGTGSQEALGLQLQRRNAMQGRLRNWLTAAQPSTVRPDVEELCTTLLPQADRMALQQPTSSTTIGAAA